MGTTVKRFHYAGDSLCLLALGLYAANRWVVKSWVPSGFLHSHFNDLWLIPAALPVVLAVQRLLGWRTHDRAPTTGEVTMHLVIWAVVSEWIGPWTFHRGVADFGDVLAYLAGGIGAWCWWNRADLTRRKFLHGF